MMSRKQLARTVADGRKITFRFADGDSFGGYLCGMDDFHWSALDPQAPLDVEIIHKGSVPRISVSSESTYQSEPTLDDMEKIIRPFREALVQENLTPPRSTPHASEGATSPC